ncbi:MAG TPA: hypothetical protein VLG69_04245 [Candidatus Andersenbacteria bacterium]|nr:hypothetical protein [Candidatus Andersenbacteria bacterium]
MANQAPVVLILENDACTQREYAVVLGEKLTLLQATTIKDAQKLFNEHIAHISAVVVRGPIFDGNISSADFADDCRRRFTGKVIGIARDGLDRGILGQSGCHFTVLTPLEVSQKIIELLG